MYESISHITIKCIHNDKYINFIKNELILSKQTGILGIKNYGVYVSRDNIRS